MQFRWIGSISLPCVVLLLGSCGGGGASSVARLNGTVAAGLPLVGTITIKDSSLPAVLRTVQIGDEGSYRVDIADLQAPLLLRAEGDVGETHYVIYSATATIAGATVNITPLTSLIIDNVAGQNAGDYFDNGNFTSLTQAALDAESAALKAKLLPVLLALGVDPDIDLLQTPFVPLESALDAALDVISISVDPITHVATITNQVNQSTITDSITVPASAEGNAPPLSGDGTAEAVDDIPKIRESLHDFIYHFRDGNNPQRAAVLALLTDTFLDNGKDRNGFFDIFDGSYFDAAGRDRGYDDDSFADIVVKQIDYDHNGGATPLAVVNFTLLDDDGVTVKGRVRDFQLIRGVDGAWRLHGNRSSTLIPDISTALQVFSLNDINSPQCRTSGLEWTIREPANNDNASIQFLNLLGPGLPTFEGATGGAGLIWSVRPPAGGAWKVNFFDGTIWRPLMSWFPMTGACLMDGWGYAPVPDATIAAFPDNMVYTARAFTSGLVEVPIGASNSGAYGRDVSGLRTMTIAKRPLTQAELAITTEFPAFTTSTNFATYSGGSITISGTVANPVPKLWIYLALTDSNGAVHSADAEVTASSGGSFSQTLSVANPGTVAVREIRVASKDVHGRSFMSNMYLRQ